MREILFRGKTTDTGEWIEGYPFFTWGMAYISWGMSGERICATKVIPKTIGQFTGLTDKNGVKIFEGDVVKYYQPYSKRWEEHIVLWDTNWASFGMFEQGSAYCKESDWVKIQHIEVIGNIHDNPELLK